MDWNAQYPLENRWDSKLFAIFPPPPPLYVLVPPIPQLIIRSNQRMEDLSKRMEVPFEKNRWDKPLFEISSGSTSSIPIKSDSHTFPRDTLPNFCNSHESPFFHHQDGELKLRFHETDQIPGFQRLQLDPEEVGDSSEEIQLRPQFSVLATPHEGVETESWRKKGDEKSDEAVRSFISDPETGVRVDENLETRTDMHFSPIVSADSEVETGSLDLNGSVNSDFFRISDHSSNLSESDQPIWKNSPLPLEDIVASIYQKPAARPNRSTQPVKREIPLHGMR